MREAKIKPKVFLSHSKRDVDFVERFADDLRKCQIDSWIDDIDIQHGQSWLDEIFENGIPACHSVFAYITPNSIGSAMVKKEIDASILQRLKDNNVAFLPYVSDSELHAQLRLDLQSLHAPVFSESNYNSMFPRILSQIWLNFSNWASAQATQSERIARLQAELKIRELEQAQGESIFSPREAKEFEYIWSRIAHNIILEVDLINDETKSPTQVFQFNLEVGSVFGSINKSSKFAFNQSQFLDYLMESLSAYLPDKTNIPPRHYLKIINPPIPSDELLSYGFLSRLANPTAPSSSRISLFLHEPYKLVFTEKFDRFRFWLTQNGKQFNQIRFESVIAS